MGMLSRFDIEGYRRRHDLEFFVETGTFTGWGLLIALLSPWRFCYSIEANPALASVADDWLRRSKTVTWSSPTGEPLSEYRLAPAFEGRFQIIVGDSTTGLRQLMPAITAPALWWLDAHCAEHYGVEGPALPLPAELALIRARPPSDVIIADDVHLYDDAIVTREVQQLREHGYDVSTQHGAIVAAPQEL